LDKEGDRGWLKEGKFERGCRLEVQNIVENGGLVLGYE
jgi:hypothetical protein